MLELIFVDKATGQVNYAITDVSFVRYITASEVGFDQSGRSGSSSFLRTETLEVQHISRLEVA